jgi:hypothetical protein
MQCSFMPFEKVLDPTKAPLFLVFFLPLDYGDDMLLRLRILNPLSALPNQIHKGIFYLLAGPGTGLKIL